jgi:hypothetical protein
MHVSAATADFLKEWLVSRPTLCLVIEAFFLTYSCIINYRLGTWTRYKTSQKTTEYVEKRYLPPPPNPSITVSDLYIKGLLQLSRYRCRQ